MSSGTAATPIEAVSRTGEEALVLTAVGGGTEPELELPVSSSGTRTGTRWTRLAEYVLPLALAASIATPASFRELRRSYRVDAETPIVVAAWDYVEELWEPVLEHITNEQVRELNALLALPYTNNHEFEYFADE